jgi:hypothetical protein
MFLEFRFLPELVNEIPAKVHGGAEVQIEKTEYADCKENPPQDRGGIPAVQDPARPPARARSHSCGILPHFTVRLPFIRYRTRGKNSG